MKFTMENVISAVKKQNPHILVNGYTEITQIRALKHGWLYCGKILKDMDEFAKNNPDFFENVDAVKINDKIYKL